MRRTLSMRMCVLISVAGTVLICWPLSDYYWCMWLVSNGTPQTGGHPTHISGTGAELCINFLKRFGLEDASAYLDAFVGATIALTLFVLIRRFFGRVEFGGTRCRQCRGTLRGLAEAVCPTCGEPI